MEEQVSVLMMKASSWRTLMAGYLPPCLAWVRVDLPEPDRPNTAATNLLPSSRVYSFWPPWQEA